MKNSFIFSNVKEEVPNPYDGLDQEGVLDKLISGAGGQPLPGRWGLAQALVNCWSAPKSGNKYFYYTKLGLNTLGIVRTYRRSLHTGIGKKTCRSS